MNTLNDIFTVMWKEWRELLFPEGRLMGGMRNVAIMLGVGGVLFPLNAGRPWFDSWLTVYVACFPAIATLNYTADSVAGERERHTLETLLASRLPDPAIVLGKILAIASYGFALVAAAQPVAILAVNIVFPRGGFVLYRPEIFASILVMGAIIPTLISAAGFLCSMTAPTARAAAQRMLLPFVAVVALPGLVPVIARKLDPSWTVSLAALTPGRIVTACALAGALVAGLTMAVAVARFDRRRVTLV